MSLRILLINATISQRDLTSKAQWNFLWYRIVMPTTANAKSGKAKIREKVNTSVQPRCSNTKWKESKRIFVFISYQDPCKYWGEKSAEALLHIFRNTWTTFFTVGSYEGVAAVPYVATEIWRAKSTPPPISAGEPRTRSRNDRSHANLDRKIYNST